MISNEKIKKRIQEAIKQSGINQTTIAKAIGIKQQTIACYLSGKAMPALDTFAKLCKYLNEDANEILGLKDEEY